MNKTLGTILLVLTIVVLAGAIFFAGTVYGRSNMMFGSSMMGQGSMMNGMMGGTMNGMMNGYGSNNPGATPLTVDQAKAAAEEYLSNLDTADLTVGEIMIFDNHAYVVIKEPTTGLGAFELLVDPVSQTAFPEHGPNMMWNLKYGALNHESMAANHQGMMGMMGGNAGMVNMMGGWDNVAPGDLSADMTITPEQAREYAQKYLDENAPDSVATAPIQFYGYYTIDFETNGVVAGMLSVNGYSGQVFLHTWHGAFIAEVEE
jgi:hypothetical protein